MPTVNVAHIEFEVRAVLNAEASRKAGHNVYNDVDYAIVTPAGGHLRVEQEVTPEKLLTWDRSEETKYRAANYRAWKAGQEIPEIGTALRMWPVITPAELKSCLDCEVRTIENLAGADENTLRKIGMGARALKDRAVAWLSSAKDVGKVANEMQAMAVENATLKADLAELRATIETMQQMQKRGAGRPSKLELTAEV